MAVAGRKCAVDLEALARALLRQRGAHGVYGSKFILSHAIGFALLVVQGCLVGIRSVAITDIYSRLIYSKFIISLLFFAPQISEVLSPAR